MTNDELARKMEQLASELKKRKPKPEDVVISLLQEILQAVRVQGWNQYIHTCPPCTRPHYPYYGYGTWGYGGVTGATTGGIAGAIQMTSGSSNFDSGNVSYTVNG